MTIHEWQPDPTEAQFFTLCPALTTFRICFARHLRHLAIDPPLEFPPISLPSLREMEIEWSHDIDPTPFLNAIDTPVLDVLFLHSSRSGFSPTVFSPTIFSIFPSAPHALKSLRFREPSFSREDFEWFLHKFGNIETLVMERPDHLAVIMEVLASPENLHSVSPKLSRLHLERADLSGIETSLTRFVEARAPSNTWQLGGYHLFVLTLQDCRVDTRHGYRVLHDLLTTHDGLVVEGLETLWCRERK
jgi:hypothetical protein